jgi:phage baseplate assembly protein W
MSIYKKIITALYLYNMADGLTYGINFPFRDSYVGKYLDLSDTNREEIRSNLIHLLLTRKGTRYYLPDFGTRLYEYIFEPLDGPTFSQIESEIRESVKEYIPGITITKLTVNPASEDDEDKGTYVNGNDERVFRVPGIGTKEHTAKIKIDYLLNDDAFNTSDFVIINL